MIDQTAIPLTEEALYRAGYLIEEGVPGEGWKVLDMQYMQHLDDDLVFTKEQALQRARDEYLNHFKNMISEREREQLGNLCRTFDVPRQAVIPLMRSLLIVMGKAKCDWLEMNYVLSELADSEEMLQAYLEKVRNPPKQDGSIVFP